MFEMKTCVTKQIYSSTAALKAAYSFLDRAYIHIADAGEDWEISFEPKTDGQDTLPAEFENELIAQTVRERVAKGTRTIREMLMARALASSVIDEEDPIARMQAEDDDIPSEEPEDILTSWFDKK